MRIFTVSSGQAFLRRIFCFLLLLVAFVMEADAQITYGAKLNIGLGKIYSYNLNHTFEAEKKEDPFIKESNSHTGLGGNIGLGGFIDYPISAKVSLHSDPSITYQSSKLYVNYLWDSLDNNNSGMRYRISSEANLKTIYFNLPVLLKYKIWEKRNLYLLSGLTLTLSSHPLMKSVEQEITTSYTTGIITSSDITKVEERVHLNKYNIFSLSFTPGIEKGFKRKLKNLSVALTANIPLTKTQMYSTDPSFSNSSIGMQLLSSEGIKAGENRAYLLNDFRMTSFFISFKYKLGTWKNK